MRKLLTLVYKDFLILVRDKAGLALLYLMPLALVALMAYLQNDTFKAILDNKMALVVLDQDHDNVGASVVESLEQSGLFKATSNWVSLFRLLPPTTSATALARVCNTLFRQRVSNPRHRPYTLPFL